MAGVAQAGGIALSIFDNVAASVEASSPLGKEAKYLELLQNVVFKVAVSILTITSGGIQNSPIGYLRHNTSHKALAMVYSIAMFLSFTVGLAVLVLSVPHPNAEAGSPTVARKLMWVSLGLMHVAVAMGTAVALVEA